MPDVAAGQLPCLAIAPLVMAAGQLPHLLVAPWKQGTWPAALTKKRATRGWGSCPAATTLSAMGWESWPAASTQERATRGGEASQRPQPCSCTSACGRWPGSLFCSCTSGCSRWPASSSRCTVGCGHWPAFFVSFHCGLWPMASFLLHSPGLWLVPAIFLPLFPLWPLFAPLPSGQAYS